MPASNNFTGTESCALLLDGVLSPRMSGLRLMLTNVRTGAGALPRSNRPGLKSNRSHGRSRPRANLFA
jgi:hypothetical protein